MMQSVTNGEASLIRMPVCPDRRIVKPSTTVVPPALPSIQKAVVFAKPRSMIDAAGPSLLRMTRSLPKLSTRSVQVPGPTTISEPLATIAAAPAIESKSPGTVKVPGIPHSSGTPSPSVSSEVPLAMSQASSMSLRLQSVKGMADSSSTARTTQFPATNSSMRFNSTTSSIRSSGSIGPLRPMIQLRPKVCGASMSRVAGNSSIELAMTPTKNGVPGGPMVTARGKSKVSSATSSTTRFSIPAMTVESSGMPLPSGSVQR